MSDKRDVLERAADFACLKLPGQPLAMHMGTSYLVHDLAAEVRRLRGTNGDLLALAKQYASECAECNGTGRVQVATDCIGGEVVPVTQGCDECADIRAAIAKAEGRA